MTKKVYIASDVHDDFEAMKKFVDYAQTQDIDEMWFLGDFSLRPYNQEILDDLIKTRDLEAFKASKRKYNSKILKEMKSILDKPGIHYRVIPGNYDPLLSDLFEDKDMHLKSSNFADVKISGYGGSDAFPPHIEFLYEMGEITLFNHQELYSFLNEEKPKIIMSHNPPQYFCDDLFDGRNVGTPAITKYILENSPKIVLGGHIHEAGPLGKNPHNVKGVAQCNDTLIINPGNLGRFELIDFPLLKTKMQFDYGTFVSLDLDDDATPRKLVQYSLSAPERKIGQVSKLEEICFK